MTKPNIIYILADDMGYGDLGCNNPDSKISTPNLDRLAKQGIVWEWDAPLIDPEQKTVAHLLREQGYDTACLGKWHLGWNWPRVNGKHPNDDVDFGVRKKEKRYALGNQIDYHSRIEGDPRPWV